ncbi:Citreoviridin biosynthesis protein D [Metarhizium brunneum]|uniref:Citreoviridin biosynthesis protein D n=1 Tax=Metarhizium brunneum TaxID=500148 RepID=A0A7D5Z2D6_9HYPO
MAPLQLKSPRGGPLSLLLFGIAITGFFALLAFPITDGFFGAMILQAHNQKIGANHSHFDTALTNWTLFDDLTNALTLFFYDLVDASSADITLLMVPFGGSAMGVWLLGMIESNRKGNKGRLPAFYTTMAMLGQLAGLGFISPIFYAMSLREQRASWHGSDVTVAPEALYTIPISIFLGMAGPTALAALPAPSVLSINQKVNLVRLWEMFPFLVYLVHLALTPLARWILERSGQRDSHRRQRLQFVYSIGFLWSAAPYWYWLAMVFSASAFPFAFAPKITKAWNFRHMLRLTNPFLLGSPLPPIPTAEFWFLQWDFWLIGVSCFVWALSLRLETPKLDALYLKGGIVVEALAYAIALGPVGAAIVLIWQRDMLLIKDDDRCKQA